VRLAYLAYRTTGMPFDAALDLAEATLKDARSESSGPLSPGPLVREIRERARAAHDSPSGPVPLRSPEEVEVLARIARLSRGRRQALHARLRRP
jgi:hypothetical protein